LIGAGGHSKVVIDALLLGGRSPGEIALRDGNPALLGRTVLDIPVAHPDFPEHLAGEKVHFAIGDCAVRAVMHARALDIGAIPTSVTHPAAMIAQSAEIGAGSFVAAGAIVAPEVAVGVSVIINHGAIIDHDCRVGDFCHIAPNATLGGGVRIGESVLIGSGSVILPGIQIGDNAVIGAGAVVIRHVDAGETRIGFPESQKKP
jgi:sugar O-acyltransferase (sialic acid O-acetyltransferase NeuD family)